MLTEAAAQGHKAAKGMIGLVKGDPGRAWASNRLGILLRNERKDTDGAEACADACRALVDLSVRRWKENEGSYRDDITCVVARLGGEG